eukprot:145189_1
MYARMSKGEIHEVVLVGGSTRIPSLASIPLDSRLLLLSVQRDWPQVILVLCQNNCKNINVDITGRDGITPLMLSTCEGKKSCLSALLQSSRPDLDLSDSADRT